MSSVRSAASAAHRAMPAQARGLLDRKSGELPHIPLFPT